MTSFKRTQRKYAQRTYRARNWSGYETGLRARWSLAVWLGLTDGKLANWDAPRPKRRRPGRQPLYSDHAIETAVTLGMVFGLAFRQTEGFLRSLLELWDLSNGVPDHTTISRRKASSGCRWMKWRSDRKCASRGASGSNRVVQQGSPLSAPGVRTRP